MSRGFRNGFYGGFAVALLIGLMLLWLWQPERQIKKHTESLFHAIERKNWQLAGALVASDYEDQWGQDRARMLERLREVFRYFRQVRFSSSSETIRIEKGAAVWRGRIVIETEQGEFGTLLKERVNSLTTPFEMEWRHSSDKPWDWKLVRVTNRELEIPGEGY